MIFDCFTFFDELELLELRLTILDDVVDRFVICEAPYTFRGEPKPLVLQQNLNRFARWRDKLLVLTLPDTPSPDPWKNEWRQRDYLETGLADAANDDIVLLGDCDEIPDPANVVRHLEPMTILGHEQRLSVGFFNRIEPDPRIGTRAVRAGDFRRFGPLSALRKFAPTSIVRGGWHFTSIGPAQTMARKLRSFSHTELDLPYFRDLHRLAVQLESENGARWVPLDETFPPVLREARWQHYVWDKPAFSAEHAVALEHAHGMIGTVPENAASIAIAGIGASWLEALRQRGAVARFAGIFPSADALPPPPGTGSWAIVDGDRVFGPAPIRRLLDAGYGVVAYLHNTRSLKALRDVTDGRAFPAGPLRGAAEWECEFTAAGAPPDETQRIVTRGVYVPFAEMADLAYALGDGVVELHGVRKHELVDLIAHAMVCTWYPRRG